MAARLQCMLVQFSACFLLLCSFSEGTNICTQYLTCGMCIGFSPSCHWCETPEFGTRCDFLENLNNRTCNHTVNPENELSAIRNESTKSGTKGEDPVQLSPQEIRLKLRPKSTIQFPLVFRQAANYPVDLYFIMDVSHTMKLYKEALGNFSQKLVDEISNITTDYQIGFGTFVDKAALPYTNQAPDQEIISCSECVPAYGFRNQLSLSRNTTKFQTKVKELQMSGNLDSPEGGFDAIMQAAACSVEIGWRNKSRKMILFSTDGSFHYAGDGKLGGFVIPNDGHCHLNPEGYYGESLNMDYPSVSQLSRKIFQKKINLIFVVPESEFTRYTRLSSFIVGSNVGKLADDSSNAIDLVRDNYNRIQSEIVLQPENHDDLEISFKVKCSDNITYNMPRCEKLGIGESVVFNVTVVPGACPADRSLWNRTFQISAVGLTEKLTVHLELICECPCELPNQEVKNSDKCNSSGTYECGICTCNPGYSGNKCDCRRSTSDNGEIEDKACRRTNTSDVCEGRGTCDCGQCSCNPIFTKDASKRYTGTYCECNNFNCPSTNGNLCGGTDRGECVCGKCRCKPGYDGYSCDCPKDETPCKDSKGGFCNQKGRCICGKCDCNGTYKGPTCEDCPTCAGDKCDEYGKCVDSCLKSKSESCNCTDSKKVEFVVDNRGYENDNWKSCLWRNSEDCNIDFVYNIMDNSIKARKTKMCAASTSKVVIVVAVVGVIIACGLFLVCIWKFVINYYDRKEYEAFLKEQGNADWSKAENPLYIKATSDFKNPIYRAGSR